MKKVILVISFITLLFSIFVFIKCFNEDGKENIKEDLLEKYHITNISIGNYWIDIVKQKASSSVKDGLIKYYDIYLDKLEEYLDVISKVNNNINVMFCPDGHPLSSIGVEYDDESHYSITVWCNDPSANVFDNYSYDDIAKKFYEIIDKSSEIMDVTGTKNELINKYGIAGIRLETSQFFGYDYAENDTTIIISEQKVYENEKIIDDYKINVENLNSFLNIIKNVKENDRKEFNKFEKSTYFIITYVDGHQIEIIDNKNDEKLIDNYTFDDLNSMFMDILE